jgi:glycosyltransferase involved in cell wall biosynthesis
MLKISYFLSHPIQYQSPLIDKISKLNHINFKTIYLSDFSLRPYFDEGLNRHIFFDTNKELKHNHEFIFQNTKNNKLFFLIKYFKILIKDRPEIVWIHGMDYYTVCAIIIAKFLRKRIILRGESNDLLKKNSKSKFLYKIYFFLLNPLILYFLSIGTKNKEFYLKYMNQEKILNLPYVVDCMQKINNTKLNKVEIKRTLGLTQDSHVLLFNAKLIERKNCEILIKAFLKIRNKIKKNIYLIIIGDGKLKQGLQFKYKFFFNIKFMGFINQSNLYKYYHICDVFVLPSHYDSWGLVVNEAMNFGKPVVTSSKVGSSYDLIKGFRNRNVFVNQYGLEQCLERIFSNERIRQEMNNKSKILINSWNMDVAQNLFKKILSNID